MPAMEGPNERQHLPTGQQRKDLTLAPTGTFLTARTVPARLHETRAALWVSAWLKMQQSEISGRSVPREIKEARHNVISATDLFLRELRRAHGRTLFGHKYGCDNRGVMAIRAAVQSRTRSPGEKEG